MALSLNRCALCGRELSQTEVGYFRLNERTDRFDLECVACHELEQLERPELSSL
jgi:hypothetical protein